MGVINLISNKQEFEEYYYTPEIVNIIVENISNEDLMFKKLVRSVINSIGGELKELLKIEPEIKRKDLSKVVAEKMLNMFNAVGINCVSINSYLYLHIGYYHFIDISRFGFLFSCFIDKFSPAVNTTYTNELVKDIYEHLSFRVNQREIPMTPPKNYINTINGIYDVVNNKRVSCKLSEYFFRNIIPVDFEKESSVIACDRFKKFISDVCNKDKDKEELLYCLMAATLRGEKLGVALILYGSGGNGKSTFLHLWHKILGDINVSCVGSSIFKNTNENNLGFLQIDGKLLNISDESPLTDKTSLEMLKQVISGNNPIAVRPLYKNEFIYVKNFPLFVFATNEATYFKTIRNDIVRRFLIVEFDAKFDGTDDKGKEIVNDIIKNEHSSIIKFLFSYDSKRFNELKGKFSVIKNENNIVSSSVFCYIRDVFLLVVKTEYEDADYINMEEVYSSTDLEDNYIAYCNRMNFKDVVDFKKFVQLFQDYFRYNAKKVVKKGANGKSRTYYFFKKSHIINELNIFDSKENQGVDDV